MAFHTDLDQSKTATRPKRKMNRLLWLYLVLYNFGSLVCWTYLFTALTNGLIQTNGKFVMSAYIMIGEETRWIQTLAILEIFHALFGIVRSPVGTTFMQVNSRLLLVWGILYTFPQDQVRRDFAFTTMLYAWSITEMVRYTFYGMNLLNAPAYVLTWARYTLFIILYPLGAVSEAVLIYRAIPFAASVYHWLPNVLYGILAVYVPGFYIMYSHMFKQRFKYIVKPSRIASDLKKAKSH